MKYAMMGAGLRGDVGRIPPAEQERRIRCHQQALNDLLRARVIAGRTGLIFVSVGLGPFHGGEGQTLSVRNREGKRLRTDGPFPETKEVAGGFDIIEVIRYVCRGEKPIDDGHVIADLGGPRFQVFTQESSKELAGRPMHNPFGRLKLVNLRDIAETN